MPNKKKITYLLKGQSFELIPAFVTLGEKEDTGSLKLNWEMFYSKILTGVRVGSELVVGRFTDEKQQVFDVYVERGTGKYFYHPGAKQGV
jgi:hypothetical protein